MKPLILVVDDDQSIRGLLDTHLSRLGYRVRAEENAEGLRTALQENDYQTILLDLQLPDADGIELISEIKKTEPELPIIMISAHGSIVRAVDAMRLGAYDFCPKPIDFNRLNVSVKNAVESNQLKKRVKTLERSKRFRLCDLIGGSAQMQMVYNIIETVAPSKAPVFITGESGCGKELVARAIHQLSPRSGKELVDVNCAAIPKDLMESELFGHERYAFTGANEQYIGRCERAHQSTLFLDELAEMDVNLQAKLLRFLQEQAFYRVGGKEKIFVDGRIISATNRNPMEAIQAGDLREDLYYRLNVVQVHIPPLREHPDDIPELAEHFLEQYSTINQKEFHDFSPEAMDTMCSYPWPGNARELENCIHQTVVLHTGEIVEREMLPDSIRNSSNNENSLRLKKGSDLKTEKEEPKIVPFDVLEREAIDNALKIMKGNVAQAAAALNLSQATIYRKIREYNLILQKYKE